MRPGGVIIPIPIEDGPGMKSCGAAVWGKVVGEPKRKDEKTRKGTRKRVDILMRTVNTRGEDGTLKKGKYQRCYITSDSVFFWIVDAAEKGDTFLLFGEYQEREYYPRKKKAYVVQDLELKIARDFLIQFAIPAQLVVDPVTYLQRFTRSADEHYSYQDPDLEIGDNDEQEGPGMDYWFRE